MNIIHLEPYQYAHIKDKTENIIYLTEGPCSYVVKSHEEVVLPQTDMIILPPNNFIRIFNPVLKVNNLVQYEEINGKKSKLAKLRFGDEEIRSNEDYSEPFPLFPGEVVTKTVTPAKLITENQALKLVAVRNFVDVDKTKRLIGDEWVSSGPLIYFDRIEEDLVEVIEATIITHNTALKVQSNQYFTDRNGIKRIPGEQWLVTKQGPFIPSAEETIVEVVKAIILSDTTAVILEATSNFIDAYNIERHVGEKWLLTNEQTCIHIQNIFENVVKTITKTILTRWDYCFIRNPVNSETGKNEYGRIIVKVGEDSFFLKPDEELVDNKINKKYILSKDVALLVLCKEAFKDILGEHKPGERWLVKGPKSYVPSVEETILEVRERISLSDTEGIYVRDIHTGQIKMITGTSYMLEAHEELWEKELPIDVKYLLENDGTYHIDNPPKLLSTKKKSQVITFTVPHNSVTQVFDFREKKNKLIFGPQLIKLEPYEQFTVLEFSGDNPKCEGKIKSLLMRLGPDYISDTVEVETSDHAKLLLKLTYSWKFNFNRNNVEDLEKLFQVKDFVGDCCKAVASRIRGIVSSVSFDDFHRDSSNIVQVGVFGKDSHGKLKKPLIFKSNNLHINNVDIQSQEPVDKKTREILNESMKLSMETNIKIKEAEAVHIENRANQEATGKVKRKEIEDETEAENKRLVLLKLEAENNSINITGLAESVSKALAEEKEIGSLSELEKAKNNLEAEKIKRKAMLLKEEKLFKEEIEHLRRMSLLQIDKAQKESVSTISKIESMVNAIGKDTLVELSKVGPESQAKILKSLGVKSFLITDGKNPINLFNTSNGIMGNGVPINSLTTN